MKDNFQGTQVNALMDDLLSRIKLELEKNKNSNAEFARSIGMSPQSLSDVLSGHRGSLNQLIRIINGLGIVVEMKLKKS